MKSTDPSTTVAMEMNLENLPEVIRFHRKKGNLSQAELARLAGIGKTAVFDIESGKQSIQLDTLIKVLRVLNIAMQFKSPLMPSFLKSQNGEPK